MVTDKSPAANSLRKVPTAVVVTFTVTVQVPGVPLGIVAPVGKVTDEAVVVGDITPQVVVAAPTIVMPAGKLSVKSAFRVARPPALLLLNVMVRFETPP
jgi:hypothetical protein